MMNDNEYYKAEDVKAAAQGRWVEILGCLAAAGSLDQAIRRTGRHVPCPIHGGKDGFRLLKDVAENGAGVCNTCGMKSDGFALLQWINHTDFKTTLNDVGEFLRVEPRKKKRSWVAERAQQKPISKAQPAPSVPQAPQQPHQPAPKPAPQPAPVTTAASYLAAKNGDVGPESEMNAGVVLDVPPLDAYDNVPPESSDQDDDLSISAALAAEWAEGGMMTACGHYPDQGKQASPTPGHAETRQKPKATVSSIAPRTQVKEREEEHLSARRKWLLEVQERQRSQAAQSAEKSMASIERVWGESFPITSPNARLGMQYLEARGIRLGRERFYSLDQGDCFRFHPSLAYYGHAEVKKTRPDGTVVKEARMIKQGEYPALICAIRNPAGELVTLHRTYLAKKGGSKARVESAKKMMTVPDGKTVTGGAIRLSMPTSEGVLAVAEGLETALSGLRATGLPTWCLVNTTLLEGFEPPKGVHTLVVWADKDKSGAGEHSANRLKARMAEKGVKVVILMPPAPIPARAKGIDWNDVLMTQGLLGFPRQRLLARWIADA